MEGFKESFKRYKNMLFFSAIILTVIVCKIFYDEHVKKTVLNNGLTAKGFIKEGYISKNRIYYKVEFDYKGYSYTFEDRPPGELQEKSKYFPLGTIVTVKFDPDDPYTAYIDYEAEIIYPKKE